MKILYLVSGVGPPAGWGTEFIQNLIFDLAKHGINATIINPIYKHTHPNWKTWCEEQNKKYGVRIIPLEVPNFIKNRYLLHLTVTPVIVTIKAIKLLLHEKFDLVHEFSSTPIILPRLGLIRFLFKVPVLFTLSVYNNTLLGKLWWIKLFDWATFYFIPCHEIIKKLITQGIDKNKLIFSPPGIELSLFYKKTDKRDARKILNLPQDKYIYTYFGPLTFEKGVFDILEASKLLPKSLLNQLLIVFYVIWKGSNKHKELKNEINGLNLQYLKIVEEYVNISTLLAASDTIILPQQTGHGATIPPISIVESLAAQKPIIATNILGNRELINERNGLLVPPQSPTAIANAMEKINHFPVPLHKSEEVFDRFNFAKSVKLHKLFYQKITKLK